MISRILAVTVFTAVVQISFGEVAFGQTLELSPYGIEQVQKGDWTSSYFSGRKLILGTTPLNDLTDALRNPKFRTPETERPAEPESPIGCGILNPRCIELPQQLDQ